MDLAVITVGRENPVPCLAEAYRLCSALRSATEQTPVFPRFLAVASRRQEVDAIFRILKARIEQEVGQIVFLEHRFLELEKEEPYRPDAVYQKMIGALRSYRGVTAVHC